MCAYLRKQNRREVIKKINGRSVEIGATARQGSGSGVWRRIFQAQLHTQWFTFNHSNCVHVNSPSLYFETNCRMESMTTETDIESDNFMWKAKWSTATKTTPPSRIHPFRFDEANDGHTMRGMCQQPAIHSFGSQKRNSFAYGFYYKLMSIFGTTFRFGLDVICEAHTYRPAAAHFFGRQIVSVGCFKLVPHFPFGISALAVHPGIVQSGKRPSATTSIHSRRAHLRSNSKVSPTKQNNSQRHNMRLS